MRNIVGAALIAVMAASSAGAGQMGQVAGTGAVVGGVGTTLAIANGSQILGASATVMGSTSLARVGTILGGFTAGAVVGVLAYVGMNTFVCLYDNDNCQADPS